MKKVILIVLLIPLKVSAQLYVNFESGTIQSWIQGVENRWDADSSGKLNGEFSLHHIYDNPSNGSDYIGLPLKDLHLSEGTTKWSFLLKHGYEPSSSNNWCVYLYCDADPASVASGVPVNGYAVGVNLTGYDDTLKLWKIANGSASVVIKSDLNWQTGIGKDAPAGINVERSSAGIWKINVSGYTDTLTAASPDPEEQLPATPWFILNYRYTSTRDRLLWFDDLRIDGIFREDKDPPDISSISVGGTNSLDIRLSEEILPSGLTASNFILNNEEVSPEGTAILVRTTLSLKFAEKFNNKKINTLLIKELCDKMGNCRENCLISFTPVWVETGDVVIAEIMADPIPPVSLPAREYLEITNISGYSFNIKNWSLLSGKERVTFPSVSISPGDNIIICLASDSLQFRNYGRIVGLKSFPVLNDDGKILVLNDSLGNLINGVEYSPGWYGNALKEGGGWSLEMVDTRYPFFAEGNWKASVSKDGGSPGKVNSVSGNNQDLLFTGIENVFPNDSNQLLLTLSETVTGLDKYAGEIYAGDSRPVKISPAEPLMRQYLIDPEQLPEKNVICSLELPPGITDFAGNTIQVSSFRFGFPVVPGKGDIVFNELLFNPLPDDPDYIELYNNSENIIDASRLFFASVNESGDTSDLVPVYTTGRCILPGSYFVVTTDRSRLTGRYNPVNEENIFNIPRLPSMPDDKGHLLLLDHKADLIDEVIYSDDMHHPLISVSEGISVEKIRYGISSADPASWHSASQSSGWGSPGGPNSAYIPYPAEKDIITLSSGRISPGNDGYEDILAIDFTLEGTGNIISATVFDETGRFVKKLTENMFAGSGATLVWDGTATDGTIVRRGIYIILIQLYNDKGKTKSWKRVCAVV